MFYYTYKITNNLNDKMYIGCHKTKRLNDSYMGSGKAIKAAIKKYGKHNFTKEILAFHSTEEQMFNHEKQLVDVDFIKREDTYNIVEGGKGGFTYVNEVISKEYILERNRRASAIFQEKLKDPIFYDFWHKRMMEGRNKS